MDPQHIPEDKKLERGILLGSVILFLLSLTQKCYCTTAECADSIMAFLLGWAALFSGGAGLTWLANPLLFAAWLTLNKKLKTSMLLSVFAALISLSFLLFDAVLDNESNQMHPVISYRPGYWLWTASALVMLAGTFVLMFRHNTRIARMWNQR
jgi:glycerol-3-phosphate acyltransferase PlsY